MENNSELNLARQIVEKTGTSLFLTGKAGTGKTTFLHSLRDTSMKRMVVLAPTGVAAINARGATIHSFFQFDFSPFIPGQGFIGEGKRFISFSKIKRRIISSLDLLVIDEISMVRPDILDAIDDSLRRLRNSRKPFGGVQLLLIGDLRQLAPVVTPDEWAILSHHYASPYFFESRALKEAGFITLELTKVYRQSDRRFIDLLNAVRENKVTEKILDDLNSRYIGNFNPGDSEGYIRLTTHNHMADSINWRRLAELQEAPVEYQASVTGKFPEYSFPADFMLTLKRGARVMFIKNDTGTDRRFYNGMLGTVVDLDENTVTVRPVEGGADIVTERAVWENTTYDMDPATNEIRQNVTGSFVQIPLRLAWAITIHKSQGLTFDKAIIDASHSFAPGQAYVALSRCRSLEGLVLDSRIHPSAIITDYKVNSFIDMQNAHRPDEETVKRMMSSYFSRVLSEVFDFEAAAGAFEDFSHAVLEFVTPVFPELYQEYKDEKVRFRSEILEVGRRFIGIYSSRYYDTDNIDQALIEKVAGGCGYFLNKLAPLVRLIKKTPLELDNKGYERRLNNAYDNVRYELKLKTDIMKGLLEVPFSPGVYMKLKAMAVLGIDEVGSGERKSNRLVKPENSRGERKGKVMKEGVMSDDLPQRPKKEEKPKSEKRPRGYSENITVNMYLDGKSISAIAEERGLVETTIAGHLGKGVKAGRLKLEDVVAPGDLEKLNELYQREDIDSYAKMREASRTHSRSPSSGTAKGNKTVEWRAWAPGSPGLA